MKAPITPRQWERLSAYLDKKLSVKNQNDLEKQLASNPALKKALNEIKHIKGILRSVPDKRVRCNFTLTAAQARPERRSVLVPVFRYASLAASLALIALLVVEFLPGLFKLSFAAPKSAEAPMMMAAPDEVQPTASTPLILWNDTGSQSQGVVEGKGGGNGNGIGGGVAVEAIYTPTPVPVPALESAPVTASGVPEAEQPVSVTPAPTTVMQERSVQATAAPPAADQAEQSSAGPLLGIPPAGSQGEIATAPFVEATRVQKTPSGFHFSLLNYIEAGLVIVALGLFVAAFFLRKRA